MKYYTLGISDDLNVIGAYPQIEKEDNYNVSSVDSYWNVSWNQFPDFMPVYNIKINDKAKATSLLSTLSGFYGLTVDVALRGLIEKFNLPAHQFYPIQVKHFGQKLEYYWFHFVNSFLNYVDFQNTIFECFKKSPLQIIGEFKFQSVDELHKKKSELSFGQGIRLKHLVLRNNFPEFDIISLWNITPIILVNTNR